MNTIYRQGDVMLRRVDALPAQAAAIPPTEPTRVILAYGESSGHAHAIDPTEAVEYTMQDAANVVRRFLSVAGGAQVRHEEHAPVDLPAGIYEVIQQVDYSPGAIRAVAD